MSPPPCLTVGMRFYSLCLVFSKGTSTFSHSLQKKKITICIPTVAHQEQVEVQQVAEQQRPQHLIIIQQNQQQQLVEQQRQQQLLIIQQQQQLAAEAEARRLQEERRQVEIKKQMEKRTEVKKEVVNKEQVIKKDVVKVTRTEPVRKKVLLSSSSSFSASSSSSQSLSELYSLRLRLEAAESTLSQHVHISVGDDGARDCGLKIIQLEVNPNSETWGWG